MVPNTFLKALTQHSLFSERFWFPKESFEGESYPTSAGDLVASLYFMIGLTALRYVLTSLVFRPAARRVLRLPASSFEPLPHEALLQNYRNKLKDSRPSTVSASSTSEKVLAALATELNMTVAEANGQLSRLSRVEGHRKRERKFIESSFRCLVYTLLCIVGVYILQDKPWVKDIARCWTDGFPVQQFVPTDVKVYYLFQLGFYLHLLVFMIFFEDRKGDFWEMGLHHISTIFLISLSWWINCVRIGTLVFVVHDISDPFLESAKLFNYARIQTPCDICFGLFAFVFGVARLYVFPFHVLNSSFFDESIPSWGGSVFLNGLLGVLQVLHCYWFYLIIKVIIGILIYGVVTKDARSETDDSDRERQDHLKKKKSS